MSMAKRGEELTSIEHGCFDTAALQQELAAALEEDRLYKLTDSMKKRAIHTAASYDEFKNMVACADLKPVTQRELQDMTKTTRSTNLFYNSSARGRRSKKTSRDQDARDLLARDVTTDPPATAIDFCRCWRRSLRSVDAKLRYLELTGPERLGSLFRNDLDADLMADIIHVLVASWGTSERNDGASACQRARFAVQTAAALASTARFSLLRDFLDNNQLDTAQELFAAIDRSADTLDDQERELVDQLRVKFRFSK